jgi:hypothetical protein
VRSLANRLAAHESLDITGEKWDIALKLPLS